MKIKLLLLAAAVCFFAQVNGQHKVKNYKFYGTISRAVLENYLSHGLQMYEYCKADEFTEFGNKIPYRDDDERMILNTGAKFVGRVIFSWGEEEKLRNPYFFQFAKSRIAALHKSDPDIIFQACIFEMVTTKVNNIPVPPWVFTAFGLPVAKRNFIYTGMLYPDGNRANQWGKGESVPDISRQETRLWFYWLAKQYIDCGIEALHFGQVEIMAETDKANDYAGWRDILSKVRGYAHKHARRGLVLCDGHVPGGGLKDAEGHLLLDFHSFPSRPKENGPQAGHDAILQAGFSDAFYGRSKGGISPSGWRCKSLPYLVELDSYGNTAHPGVAGPEQYHVWGYDEINWLASQPENYRNNWLRYAYNRVHQLDSNGYFIMPGAAPASTFRANTKSRACPVGGNAEETIKQIWNY